MNQYLDILSIFLIAIFLLFSLKNQEKGIVFGILIKPLVDTSWDISFSGVSIIELYSVIFLVICFRLLFQIGINPNYKGLVILWFVAHLGVVFQLTTEPIEGIKSLLKVLYFPLSVFILPYFLIYSEHHYHKLIIKALLIGALFSSVISILQFIGIIPYEFYHMSKGLQRANGFYHDMVTSRIYVFQGLLTLTYINFSNRFTIKPRTNWFLLIIFLVSSYTLFSKALIGIIVFVAILFLLIIKQKLINYLIGFALFLVLYNNSKFETILITTKILFNSEIEYNTSYQYDSDRLFSGRGGIWRGYLHSFEKGSIIEKAIGFGINSGRTHNEFLRILILSGVIGFIFYIIFLLNLIFKISLSRLFNSRLLFVSFFSLIILLIDSISVVWGLYPFYLIVVIGFYVTANEEIKIKIV